MYIFLVIIITLIALLMAIAVLLQSGKGGGLAGIAAGGQTTQILGARQAPDTLEKATWTLGTVFIVLCILANFFANPSDAQRSVIQEGGGANAPIESTLPPGAVESEAPAPVEAPPVESE